jgi:hypothetical protein
LYVVTYAKKGKKNNPPAYLLQEAPRIFEVTALESIRQKYWIGHSGDVGEIVLTLQLRVGCTREVGIGTRFVQSFHLNGSRFSQIFKKYSQFLKKVNEAELAGAVREECTKSLGEQALLIAAQVFAGAHDDDFNKVLLFPVFPKGVSGT